MFIFLYRWLVVYNVSHCFQFYLKSPSTHQTNCYSIGFGWQLPYQQLPCSTSGRKSSPAKTRTGPWMEARWREWWCSSMQAWTEKRSFQNFFQNLKPKIRIELATTRSASDVIESVISVLLNYSRKLLKPGFKVDLRNDETILNCFLMICWESTKMCVLCDNLYVNRLLCYIVGKLWTFEDLGQKTF